MTVKEIVEILEGSIIYGEDFLDREVHTACGSDMMSDVLEMMDMKCIVFVRGKSPDIGMINLAEDRDIVLIKTDLEMFTSCGKLYANGLRGGSGK